MSTESQHHRTAGADLDLVRLHCGIQHYAWGDPAFIPNLLSLSNPKDLPYAELWMGAHPDLPAAVDLPGRSRRVLLHDWIGSAPEAILGPGVVRNFGAALPYLFKILSAAAPLSIQVHPSNQRAAEGFARENAAGIPMTAPFRNYKDSRHKPELFVALTDAYGLRGFRPLTEIDALLRDVPEFEPLQAAFHPTPAGLQTLYETFMTWPQPRIDSILGPWLDRLARRHAQTPFARHDREYWVLHADRHYSRDGHHDRGLFSIGLLNFVRLEPGEGMDLPAGVLHAYLEGAGVELMANSNNVIRGGLTPKHVDVPELLRNVSFEGAPLHKVLPVPLTAFDSVYPSKASEFELHRIGLQAGQTHSQSALHNIDILILLHAGEGSRVTVSSHGTSRPWTLGEVFLAPHGVAYDVAATGPATLFRATVP